MSFIYAMSDMHGHFKILKETLQIIDLSSDNENKLIFCGDYIGYGADSYKTLNLVKELTCSYPGQVYALTGNHEHMFLEFLSSTPNDIWNYEWLRADKELDTVRSFISNETINKILNLKIKCINEYTYFIKISKVIKDDILKRHADLIKWLKKLPYFHETQKQIFVHAGIDEEAGEYWKWGSENYYFCSKYPHSFGKFDKDIVAGHIGTCSIANNANYHSVFCDKQSHYYIDGSTVISGCIPVLKYDTDLDVYTSFEKKITNDNVNEWHEYVIK